MSVFHLSWPSEVAGNADEYLSLDRGPDGTWEVAATHCTWCPVDGGAGQVAAFARWLLNPPPGGYDCDFTLVDRSALPDRRQFWPVEIDVTLTRRPADGPESMSVSLDEIMLLWEPADRARIERAATALLAAVTP